MIVTLGWEDTQSFIKTSLILNYVVILIVKGSWNLRHDNFSRFFIGPSLQSADGGVELCELFGHGPRWRLQLQTPRESLIKEFNH